MGTRNYIAVISTVNCSASVAKYVARHFDERQLRDYEQVDGVIALTHEGGCALQFAGQAHQMLNRVLAGMAQHPNIGGYLLIGLGCEQAAMQYLLDQQQLVHLDGAGARGTAAVFSMQDQGGTRKTVEAGIAAVQAMLPPVNAVRRERVPAAAN